MVASSRECRTLKITGPSVCAAWPGHTPLIHQEGALTVWTVFVTDADLHVLVSTLRDIGLTVDVFEQSRTLDPMPTAQCGSCSWYEPGSGCAVEFRVPPRQGTVLYLESCPIYGQSLSMSSTD